MIPRGAFDNGGVIPTGRQRHWTDIEPESEAEPEQMARSHCLICEVDWFDLPSKGCWSCGGVSLPGICPVNAPSDYMGRRSYAGPHSDPTLANIRADSGDPDRTR